MGKNIKKSSLREVDIGIFFTFSTVSLALLGNLSYDLTRLLQSADLHDVMSDIVTKLLSSPKPCSSFLITLLGGVSMSLNPVSLRVTFSWRAGRFDTLSGWLWTTKSSWITSYWFVCMAALQPLMVQFHVVKTTPWWPKANFWQGFPDVVSERILKLNEKCWSAVAIYTGHGFEVTIDVSNHHAEFICSWMLLCFFNTQPGLLNLMRPINCAIKGTKMIDKIMRFVLFKSHTFYELCYLSSPVFEDV